MAENRSTYTRLHNWYAEALAKNPDLPPPLRVFLLLVRLTFGYHTKERPISLSDITNGTGLPKRSIQRVLNHFLNVGLVEFRWDRTGKRTIIMITDKRKLKTQAGIAFEVPKGDKSAPPDKGVTNPHPRGDKSAPKVVTNPHPRGDKSAPPILVKESFKEKKKVLKKVPDWIDAEAFNKFAEWRAEIGKPITEKNMDSFFNELWRILNGMYWRQEEVYDRCMARGWAMLTSPIERHHDPLMNYPPEERQNDQQA